MLKRQSDNETKVLKAKVLFFYHDSNILMQTHHLCNKTSSVFWDSDNETLISNSAGTSGLKNRVRSREHVR